MKQIINGKEYEFVTISTLAKMSRRKASTLRKWEFTGILPPANFRTPDVPIIGGKSRLGVRLYTLELAIKVSELIRNTVYQGVAIPQETLVKFKELFSEERKKVGG